jgi:spermidine/putrescine transport system substrate-binding protein
MKENLYGLEVDSGKGDIVTGKISMNLAWSGDAVYSMDLAEEYDNYLEYCIPVEGGNVWFDGWVMPKGANKELAQAFINYLSFPSVAAQNMEEIGYVSVVSSPRILEWANDAETYPTPSDLSYFFGPDADSVHVNNIFYPDKSVIDRCALMHDCGDKTEDLINMWSRIKGDNLSTGMVVFVCIILSLIVVVFILQVINRRRQRKLQQKKRKHKKNN